MMDLGPKEEEMTHHRLRQQPPRPARTQRAPPLGEMRVSGALQQVQVAPDWRNVAPPPPLQTLTTRWPNHVRDAGQVLDVSPLAG